MFWGGDGGSCRGVPTVLIALSRGRRDEGHRIRLLQGLVAPVISSFCPNLTHLPPAGVCCPSLAALRVPWGQGASCHCPHGFCHYPVGPGSVPMGPVTIPLSPAIILVGFAGVPMAPATIPMDLTGVTKGPTIIPMDPASLSTRPPGVPWVVPVSPWPSRVVPLFHPPQDGASVWLWVLLININFWRGCGVCGESQMGGAGDGQLRAEARTWGHAFFIECTRGYFYFFLFPSSSPRC